MKSLLSSIILLLIMTAFAFAQDSQESIFSFGLKSGVSDYSFSSDRVNA
ncbi:hypothetical protein [Psychroflexus tropicus]|nr:hypothetical protein [Psychroflexus tropicus]